MWNISTGKILVKTKIKSKSLLGYINKLKYNQSANSFLLLTDKFEVGFFRNFDLISLVKLAERDEFEKKLVLIDTIKFESNQTQSAIINDLLVFNLRNFEYFKVKQFSLDNDNEDINDDVEHVQLNIDGKKVDINLNSEENLVIFCKELNYLIVVDKHIERFFAFSYEDSTIVSDNKKSNTIRFQYKNDQKQLKLFLSLYALATYRFKVVHFDNFELFFVLSVLKPTEDELQPFVEINHVLMKARIIATVNRRDDRTIEFEIAKVYPFCYSYNLFKYFTAQREELVACFNLAADLEMDLIRDKTEFNLIHAQNRDLFNMNEVQVVILNRNQKIFSLKLDDNSVVKKMCVDARLEYFVLGDDKKLISLYRVKDAQRLAYMPLYGEINQIRYSGDSRFVCLNMNDRRIFSLLIVDPKNPEHAQRIKELPSRNVDFDDDSRQNEKLKSILEEDEADKEMNKAASRSTSSSDQKNVDSTDESERSDDEYKEQAYMCRRDRRANMTRTTSTRRSTNERDDEHASQSKFDSR